MTRNDLYLPLAVVKKPRLSHLLVWSAGLPIVGIRINADAPSGCEQTDHLNILGCHEFDEVFHDDIDTVLVEVAVVSKAEEIKFQTLTFHHAFRWHVTDAYLSKVRLPRDGTQRCELGTVELDPIVVFRMFVVESLQHLGGVIHAVTCFGAQ